MSGNNQDYDNYDDENVGDNEEYDSQDDISQNNGDHGDDDEDCDINDENNCDGDDDEDEDDNDDDNDNGENNNNNGPKYIRLRGLPWSATHKEILDFLKNVNVIGGASGIHLITSRWDGKNTGEAYVEVKSQQDVTAAMKLDNATMGHRYIEVFNASPREAKEAMRKTSSHGNSYVVKLRGLPYSVTEQQVEEFFNGLEIKADREGIIFVTDRRGRATGEAFVQFESQEDTEQALGRNREKIGHRYIEIFRSSLAELRRSTNGNGRMAPYDLRERGSNRSGSGGGGGGSGNDNRNNRWGNNSSFGVGANNKLGFNNIPNFGNDGNFGNNGGNFGNFGGGGGGASGMGNFGNFGNNSGGPSGNFGGFGSSSSGNFGNNPMGNNSGGGGGFNRFSGNSGNFGNDFGDFGNFGNNRGNGGGGGGGGMGGGVAGGLNNSSGGNDGFNNFGNFGNNMGGGSNSGGLSAGFGGNMTGISGGVSGGNFGPIGGGRNDEVYVVLMRGLPFSSYEKEVYKFFEPLRPVHVRIHVQKKSGRHNGTAEAHFGSYEYAQLAMKRHRCKMGQRYIELLFNGKTSKSNGNNYSSGNSIGGGSIGSGGNSIGNSGFSRRI